MNKLELVEKIKSQVKEQKRKSEEQHCTDRVRDVSFGRYLAFAIVLDWLEDLDE